MTEVAMPKEALDSESRDVSAAASGREPGSEGAEHVTRPVPPLKHWRRARGWAPHELADLVRCPRAVLLAVERGEEALSEDLERRLEAIFEVEPGTLRQPPNPVLAKWGLVGEEIVGRALLSSDAGLLLGEDTPVGMVIEAALRRWARQLLPSSEEARTTHRAAIKVLRLQWKASQWAGPLRDINVGAQQYERGFCGFHIDNVAVAAQLASASGLDSEFVRTSLVGCRRLPMQPGGEHLFIGGPSSTPCSRLALEYEWSTESGNEGWVGRSNPMLPLPYRWDKRRRKRGAEMGRIMEGAGEAGGPGPVPAHSWPLIATNPSNDTEAELRAAMGSCIHVGNRELPVQLGDYLLLTRIPNVCDPEFTRLLEAVPEDEEDLRSLPHILIVEGGDGAGTRAVELLFRSQGLEAMQRIEDLVHEAPAFQIVLEVGDMEVENGFHVANTIQRVVTAQPLPLLFSHPREYRHRLQRLHAYVRATA